MVIHIQPNEQVEVQATLDGAPLRVNATGNQHWAVVGINPYENARNMELVTEAATRSATVRGRRLGSRSSRSSSRPIGCKYRRRCWR